MCTLAVLCLLRFYPPGAKMYFGPHCVQLDPPDVLQPLRRASVGATREDLSILDSILRRLPTRYRLDNPDVHYILSASRAGLEALRHTHAASQTIAQNLQHDIALIERLLDEHGRVQRTPPRDEEQTEAGDDPERGRSCDDGDASESSGSFPRSTVGGQDPPSSSPVVPLHVQAGADAASSRHFQQLWSAPEVHVLALLLREADRSLSAAVSDPLCLDEASTYVACVEAMLRDKERRIEHLFEQAVAELHC